MTTEAVKLENKIVGTIEAEAAHVLAYLKRISESTETELVQSEIYKDAVKAKQRMNEFISKMILEAKLDPDLHGISPDFKNFVEIEQTPIPPIATELPSNAPATESTT